MSVFNSINMNDIHTLFHIPLDSLLSFFCPTKRKKSTVQQAMAIVTMVNLNPYEAVGFTEVTYWKVFLFFSFYSPT